MTAQLTAHRIDVPGASVYYETRGAGSLLLVVGQPMTSGAFAPLADRLAADHTVLTYDPRGLGESTVEDPEKPVTPEVQADDLACIVETLGGGAADVVGSSGGAVAALALAAARPELVRTVVAHEPPLTELLPDAAAVRSAVDGIETAYGSHGARAAWGAFISLVMHSGHVPADGVPPASWPPPGADGADADAAGPPEPSPKQEAEDALFFLRMLKPFTRYLPEVDVLRSSEARVVVAIGETSGEEIARRSAVAFAERLGTPPVVFPGHHGGFLDDPEAFADAVRRCLAP